MATPSQNQILRTLEERITSSALRDHVKQVRFINGTSVNINTAVSGAGGDVGYLVIISYGSDNKDIPNVEGLPDGTS